MTTATESDSTEQGASGQRHGAVLPPALSVAALFFVGAIAICVGVELTPFIMGVGADVANTGGNRLTQTGGIMWNVFGPGLPYVLLGCVLAVVSHFSSKKMRDPLTYTALVLCICTCIFHFFSPLLRRLGELENLKGLAESPRGFAIFYCIAGTFAMYITWLMVGLALHRIDPADDRAC
jgi:hypothetical protein